SVERNHHRDSVFKMMALWYRCRSSSMTRSGTTAPNGMLVSPFWATVVQEVKKSFDNQKVASSIPCRSVLEQDTEPLFAPDVQCAISVKMKMCIHPCKSLWIKASAK